MRKFSILSAVLVALMAILVIVEAKSIERIYGGKEAAPGQFPHQVSIRKPWFFDNGKWHVCGGVIISDRFILTTANCTQGDLSFPSNVTVVVGTLLSIPFTPGTSYNVSKIIVHPRFNRLTRENDISVLKTVQ